MSELGTVISFRKEEGEGEREGKTINLFTPDYLNLPMYG